MRCLALIFIIAVIFSLFSCAANGGKSDEEQIEGIRDTTLLLPDSLGYVTISIPDRFDTFFTWIRQSDCGHCGDVRYRFQPKNRKIFKESGFFYFRTNDSTEQFTIQHHQTIGNVSISFDDDFLHSGAILGAKSDLMVRKVQFDTIQEINGKQFSVITVDDFDTSTRSYLKGVYATTFIHGNQVRFK